MGFVDDDSDSEVESDPLGIQAHTEVNLANGKESPTHNYRTLSNDDPRTPTTKNNDLLNITRLRRKGITESEEIWGELEDDAFVELPPSSCPRGSATSNPLKSHYGADPLDESTNESTVLLARSGTCRSYRDKRRRRSTPRSEVQERQRVRRSVSSQEVSGSWWKVKTWWRGKERKDKGKGTGNGIGNRNGDSA